MSQEFILGLEAPNFELSDQTGKTVSLHSVLKEGPVMLVFYPGDFTMVCTKQLCNYRDHWSDFKGFGIQVVGVSANTTQDHARFAEEFKFPFLLLSDPKKQVAKAYGCTSLLMFGGISRAVFLISKDGVGRYRYVEPTILTRRKASELIGIIADLRARELL